MSKTTSESAEIRYNAADPTDTQHLRSSFQQDVTGRWERVTEANEQWVRELSQPLDYGTLIGRYRDRIRTLVTTTVQEQASDAAIRRGNHWTGSFVRQAYQHGLQQAKSELLAVGYAPQRVSQATDFGHETHQRKIGQEYALAYATLDDQTSWAVKEVTTTMRTAVDDQRDQSWLAEATTSALESSVVNAARSHANTTVVRTVNEAKLNAYELVGVEEVSAVPESRADATAGDAVIRQNVRRVNARDEDDPETGSEALRESEDAETDAPEDPTLERTFVTADDDDVCDVCRALEGETFTIATIRSAGFDAIPVHPNCRCTWSPPRAPS